MTRSYVFIYLVFFSVFLEKGTMEDIKMKVKK